MQDLNSWIEAQLKRGYSRKQIKSALIRKGYSPKAVAEVDKVGFSNLPSKKTPKKNSYPLILILVVIVIGIVYFMSIYRGIESSTTTGEIQTTTGVQTRDTQSIIGICHDFPSIDNEISCQNAINIALETYPGEVYSVNKTEILPLLEGQDPTEKFWAVGINLDEPIEKELPAGSFASRAEIFISADTGTISVLRLS